MDLSDYLTILIFGFPAGIISLLLAALAIWKKWPWLLALAGLCAISVTFYASLLSGLPFYLLALCQFYDAYVLHKGNRRLAWMLLMPLLLFTAYFASTSIKNLLASS